MNYTDSQDNYRVREDGGEYHAEMLYLCKEGEVWLPLKADGYWADPAAYSTGEVTNRAPMSEVEAQRAVWRARLVNKGATT